MPQGWGGPGYGRSNNLLPRQQQPQPVVPQPTPAPVPTPQSGGTQTPRSTSQPQPAAPRAPRAPAPGKWERERQRRQALKDQGTELFGPYTAEQLRARPDLVQRLKPAARARWEQAQGGGGGAGKGGGGKGKGGGKGAGGNGGAGSGSSGAGSPGAGSGSGTSSSVPRPMGPSPFPYPGVPMPSPRPDFGPESLTDPMMMFLSAVPGMRVNAQRQIGDAIADAGFTGNRWSTSAARAAGEIGAEQAMNENALLQKLLYDYANNQENRALQATNTALGAARLEDDLATSRITLPFQVGAWEQGRQDDFSRMAFEDWQQNRLGWLGPMLEAAKSQGAGSPGSPGSVITVPDKPAEPGVSDWLTLLSNFW